MKGFKSERELINQKLQELEKKMELYMNSVGMPISQEPKSTKELSREDASRLVNKVLEHSAEIDKQWDALAGTVGASWDSPMADAIYSTLQSLFEYTEMLLEDDLETLSWFIWENASGNSSRMHEMPDGTMREVKSVEDLLDVMGF